MIFVITLVLALVFLPLPWNVVAIGLAGVGEVTFWVAGVSYSRRRRAAVGVETMIGTIAEAITPLAPDGQVRVDGEIWHAHAAAGAAAGAAVRITRVDGLTLEVEPAETP